MSKLIQQVPVPSNNQSEFALYHALAQPEGSMLDQSMFQPDELIFVHTK